MKYLPTIDMWANDGVMQTALRQGQLKLQPGQWIRCGQESPSRFVRVTKAGSIWAVHPGEGGFITRKHFSECCRLWQDPQRNRKAK